MKVIRGGFGSRKTAFDRPGAGRRRRRRPGLPGRRPLGPRSARPAGTRARPPSSSAPPPARSPRRRCASGCPPRTWRPRSTGCPRPAGAAPSSAASSPPTSSRSPPRRSASLFRPWNLPSPALITRAIRRPLAFRPDVAAMTLLPRGRIDISERARGLDEHMGSRWPDGLRICTVRRSDGARVVFGRDGAPPARLAAAVLASCAIPGYFQPVDIGGTEYVDGGVHSATNADVLRSEGLDVVVVISSMSAAHGSANGADGWIRRTVHRRMEREIARLQEAGAVGDQPGARRRVAPGHGAARHGRGPRPAGDRGRLRGDPRADPRHPRPRLARAARSPPPPPADPGTAGPPRGRLRARGKPEGRVDES